MCDPSAPVSKETTASKGEAKRSVRASGRGKSRHCKCSEDRWRARLTNEIEPSSLSASAQFNNGDDGEDEGELRCNGTLPHEDNSET